MASGPAADPMAAAVAVAAPAVPMVTLKVTYQGTTQRGKIQLHQAQPENLEKILRNFLKIPAETDILIERYSDSAAAYVLLDRANASVYKQLYRAAKAKSKLKLRVTHKNTEEKKTAPQPVTVEDEPENASPSDSAAETKVEAESTEEEATDKEQQPSTAQTPEALDPAPSLPAAGSETTLPLRSSSASTMRMPPQLVLSASPPALELPSSDALSALVNELRQKSSKETLTSAVLEKARATVAQRQVQREAEKQAEKQANTEAPKQAEKPAPSPSCNTPAYPATGATFAICCNSCERTIPGPHYHCSTCDDGDFDLCQSCVDQNISCYSTTHWLIKRTVVNGQFIHSTTELICPKRPAQMSEDKQPAPKPEPTKAAAPKPVVAEPAAKPAAPRTPTSIFSVTPRAPMFASSVRTCNSCIRELSDKEFLHCDDCEDFDLCQRCFGQGKHGHHPKHRFTAAVKDAVVPDHLKVKMLPGRNQLHHAICDGCDKYVTGVRHKCLDCPDWDYCSGCYEHASFVHPDHRFVPIYEPLGDVKIYSPPRPVHVGVCCDGPLCSEGTSSPKYIRGIRYKCAICPDIDFCANCEACPANEHNKTHPLVKFKTPVRQVTINTAGEHGDGTPMRLMGDRTKSQETVAKKEPASAPSINTVQTVVDVKPSEPAAAPKEKPAAVTSPKVKDEEPFSAVFVRDSVADGTILPSNYVFSQTWVLRNEGTVAWPAGCSVKFVGGDYMGRVDSAHPAGIPELVAANESTVCPGPLAPGREFGFTVALRTPARAGKIVSYWRLATPEGISFGHRLWCDVNVRLAKPVEPKAEEPKAEEPKAEEALKGSTLAFPKLEKESPVSSIHEASPASAAPSQKHSADAEDFEDCAEESEWDASEDGFMTDEEYDILDASDEEYLEQQEKRPLKK
jgi:next-to-BRCA1 protein 1